MRRFLLKCALAGCWVGMAMSASAGVVFQFHAPTGGGGGTGATTALGNQLDGAASGSFTQSGLMITAQASVGTFNTTAAGGFGIDQTGSFASLFEDSTGFNVGGSFGFFGTVASEGLSLQFDAPVALNSLDVSSFVNGTDQIGVSVGGASIATISANGTTSLGGYVLPANTNVEFTTTAGGGIGDGWSLAAIDVTAVPEVVSGWSLGIILGVGVLLRRRRG